jgi:hypothetical protein
LDESPRQGNGSGNRGCELSEYNCALVPKGEPRVPHNKDNKWRIVGKPEILDGNGGHIGNQSMSVEFNYGQLRTFNDELYAFAKVTDNNSTGWIPLSAIEDLQSFHTPIISAKGAGLAKMACYAVRNVAADPVYHYLFPADKYDNSILPQADDYLPLMRANNKISVNLTFNLPGFYFGGAAVDHFPAGTKFQRVKVTSTDENGHRPSIERKLYKLVDANGKMVLEDRLRDGLRLVESDRTLTWVYGYVIAKTGTKRNGWMPLEALEKSDGCDGGAAPPADPPDPANPVDPTDPVDPPPPDSTGAHFSVGDYNGDGRDDWSWYHEPTNHFIVMLSNGDGHFTAVENDTSGWGPWADGSHFRVGDYNADGRDDWSWYHQPTNHFIVMLSNGDGHFTAVENDTSGWGPWADGSHFSVGDYNADGRDDWSWYHEPTNHFIVMLSSGDGHFAAVENDTTGWGPWADGSHFTVGDYNADGRDDWSWYHQPTNHFIVMLSNGDGHFTAVENDTTGWGPWADGSHFSAGDYNADGRGDWSWYHEPTNHFIVMLSSGDGHFAAVENDTTGWGPWADGSHFSVGDYNADGRDDWSWYHPPTNNFIVMLSNGDGHFSAVGNDTSGWGRW